MKSLAGYPSHRVRHTTKERAYLFSSSTPVRHAGAAAEDPLCSQFAAPASECEGIPTAVPISPSPCPLVAGKLALHSHLSQFTQHSLLLHLQPTSQSPSHNNTAHTAMSLRTIKSDSACFAPSSNHLASTLNLSLRFQGDVAERPADGCCRMVVSVLRNVIGRRHLRLASASSIQSPSSHSACAW